MDLRSFQEAYRIELRIRWTTQVCTIACGQIEPTASGSPDSPSQQTISTSRMPRLRSSVSTPSQNRAPSLASIHMPSTRLRPSRLTPTARWQARIRTAPPSRTRTRIASIYRIG